MRASSVDRVIKETEVPRRRALRATYRRATPLPTTTRKP